MFQVGQRVLCVNDDYPAGAFSGEEHLPIAKRIYTVRDSFMISGVVDVVRLHEIRNAPRHYDIGFKECAFCSHHFRPIDDSALDVFRKMLVTPPGEPVVAAE